MQYYFEVATITTTITKKRYILIIARIINMMINVTITIIILLITNNTNININKTGHYKNNQMSKTKKQYQIIQKNKKYEIKYIPLASAFLLFKLLAPLNIFIAHNKLSAH